MQLLQPQGSKNYDFLRNRLVYSLNEEMLPFAAHHWQIQGFTLQLSSKLNDPLQTAAEMFSPFWETMQKFALPK